MPVVEARQVVFLVGRVDAVVEEGEADQQRIHAEEALEVADDRDRAAGAASDGRLAPFLRQRVQRLLQERAVDRQRDRRGLPPCSRNSTVQSAGTCARTKARKAARIFSGSCLSTRRNETLAEAFDGDDRLEALAGIAADDAVDLAVGRAQTCSSTERPFSPAGIDRPTSAEELLARRTASRSHCAFTAAGELLDAVVEAGQGDAAVVVVQAGEDLRENVDRVARGAAEHAGMQVAVGAR